MRYARSAFGERPHGPIRRGSGPRPSQLCGARGAAATQPRRRDLGLPTCLRRMLGWPPRRGIGGGPVRCGADSDHFT
ncbi:hypothetical protein IscW_ISCW012631 [Ixodes scapularis]|uniref:Uncharacterized protein n=1 Tax=Ixodes scapularis TaxID=6945 RepID=B7QBD3_IXOSC|nr:hypothetical protein IscW_ISCW012631 [Ixodes scapularis]|eukprot:XP_002412859.1 hypothetical protein IscW_ISCW012631 [Ixodes scapularis]